MNTNPLALIVLNIGGRSLYPASRASMQAAASRWSCDYVEVTRPLARPLGRHISAVWSKTVVWRTVGAQFQRVLVLDADILIREDCPSPFAVVPEGSFGVVSRFQGPLPPGFIDTTCVRWAHKLRLQKVPPPERSLNGGFVLYEPQTHAAVLRRWETAGKAVAHRYWSLVDQASLSVLLYNTDVPQTWLPSEWDLVGACQRHTQSRAPAGRMAAYVYHFTNQRGRRARIAACQWRTGKVST
jgi:hypothetical protein